MVNKTLMSIITSSAILTSSPVFAQGCYLFNPDKSPVGVWHGQCAPITNHSFCKYRGDCESLYATGYGSASGNDVKYIGMAKNGLPNGNGKIISYLSNGEVNIFEGYLNEGYRITGTEKYGNRFIFKGSFDGRSPYRGVMTDGNGKLLHSGGFSSDDNGKISFDSENYFLENILGISLGMVFVASTGAALVGSAALMAIRTNPSALLIVLIPK